MVVLVVVAVRLLTTLLWLHLRLLLSLLEAVVAPTIRAEHLL
jgi:hypothetical protein